MNKEFKEYVTNTAFNLSLSKNMVKTLVQIRDYDIEGMLNNSHFVTSADRMVKRGLVIHDFKGIDKQSWFLTTAGELVYKLICEAELDE